MKTTFPERLEYGRLTSGAWGTSKDDGGNGAFIVTCPKTSTTLRIIACDAQHPDADGWEHVSVSLPQRCPNWIEMCFVKDLFWDDEETVIQFHPPKSVYVNDNIYCLHLWKDTKNGHRLPPTDMVGRIVGEDLKGLAKVTMERLRESGGPFKK